MRTKATNLTSTAILSAGECWLEGMYVNSTTSGKIRLWHRGTAGEIDVGDALAGQMTPAAGWHCLAGMHATAGIYVSFDSGSADITFLVREMDN